MKKFFALAALVSVALTGCVTNEQFEDATPSEVQFNAVARTQTKALFEGATFTKGTDTFQTWGFYSNDGFATNAEFALSNKTIEWVDASNAWKVNGETYYWPLQGQVGFFGLYPHDFAPTSVSYENGIKIEDHDVVAHPTVDVMYAYNVGQKGSSPLAMVFSHALSQVGATVATDKDYPGATLTITSIAFKNVDVEATFTQKATPQWTNNTDAQTATMPLIAPGTAPTLSASPVNYGDTNVVAIPQTLATGSGTNAKLSIAYTLTQNGKDISGVVEPTIIATTNTEANTWESGKKYIYNITFKLEEITFNPSATDWVTVTTDAISIEG